MNALTPSPIFEGLHEPGFNASEHEGLEKLKVCNKFKPRLSNRGLEEMDDDEEDTSKKRKRGGRKKQVIVPCARTRNKIYIYIYIYICMFIYIYIQRIISLVHEREPVAVDL